MSGTCNYCRQSPCGCGSRNVYRSHQPPQQYPSTPHPYQYPPYYGYGVVPPCPPQTCLEKSESCDFGPAQPINKGMFQAIDGCGKPVPFAKVTVLYASTNEKVALYYKPIANPQFAQQNPVITDERGRAPIHYFSKGHDIRVIVERDCGAGNIEQIDNFINYAATLEGNFDLSTIDDKNCITIDNPRVLVYDKADCNKPAHLIDLRWALIRANIDAGVPAGKYADVKAYYECLGTDWDDGVIVYGDCSICPETYIYKDSCPEECPPDPCNVTFDDFGDSPCWTRCAGSNGSLALGQQAFTGEFAILDFETDDPSTTITSPEICHTVTNESETKSMLVFLDLTLQASQEGLFGNGFTYPSIYALEQKADGVNWIPVIEGHTQSWVNTNSADAGSTQQEETPTSVQNLISLQPGESREICLRVIVSSSGNWGVSKATNTHTARARPVLTINGGVLV